MKKIAIICLALSIFVFPGITLAEIIGNTDEEVKTVADPVIEQILQAMADDDYQRYSEKFDAALKQKITEDKFIEKRQQIIDVFGGYLFREYIGFVNKKDSTLVLWKGTFDRTKDDVLINLMISNVNGQILVQGLYYQ